MQKIVNELINSSIRRVDVYRWKDATWLIFTDEVRWVVELTDEGTLWYNYKFFNDVFKYVSMDLGQQTEKYIIQWANDFFYKDCAYRATAYPRDIGRNETSNVIENGIKETQQRGKDHGDEFEWYTRAVINKSVKEISQSSRVESNSEVIGEVIDKGIKEVNNSESIHRKMRAENLVPRIIKDVKPNRVIVHNEKMDRFYYDPNCRANKTEIWRIVEEVKPNVVFHGIDKKSMSFVPCNGNTTDINHIVKEGVKEIKPNIEYSQQSGVYHPDCVANHVKIENIIEEGVKEIKPSIWTTKRGIHIDDLMCSGNTTDISSIVKSGVKNIYPDMDPEVYDWSDEFKADNVIQGGIKVIPLPTIKDLRGYTDYYNTKEDRTKPHTEYVKDAIEGGTKL
jgi:hypothetical protein